MAQRQLEKNPDCITHNSCNRERQRTFYTEICLLRLNISLSKSKHLFLFFVII